MTFPVTPTDDAAPPTPTEIARREALRVERRLADLRRWAALCVETADYLADDVRAVPSARACELLDVAGDALRDAALALWAARAETQPQGAPRRRAA